MSQESISLDALQALDDLHAAQRALKAVECKAADQAARYNQPPERRVQWTALSILSSLTIVSLQLVCSKWGECSGLVRHELARRDRPSAVGEVR